MFSMEPCHECKFSHFYSYKYLSSPPRWMRYTFSHWSMDDNTRISVWTAGVAVISYLILIYLRSIATWRARTRGRPFPPGPKPLPIIGNLFNVPRVKPWLRYRDLCATYGDVVHFRVLGQSIVVLGSTEVLFEYLDKRSASTSDRKQIPMIELSGSSLNIGFMPYGQWWRRHRRAFWQFFHRDASAHYHGVQRAAAHRFLHRLLIDPSRLKDHARYTFSASVLKVAYDIDVAEDNDEFVMIAEAALEGPAQGLIPGTFLVDYLPFLRNVPTWFPGATSQRLWAKWQAAAARLKDVPYAQVKAAMERQEEPQSVTGKLVARLPSHLEPSAALEEEEIIKNVGAIAFEAGTDTTFSALLSVFVAISLHPEVLRMAHAELDIVVGPHRLPDFYDQDSLVYVNAIIKEALRWHSVLPIGVPHSTTVDDEFHGYFIPAGTVLIPNTWACMHDPEVYDDPEEFRPERFIRDGKFDPAVPDPRDFIFGYGRRICPGRYFAEASLFINIASVLHVFDITPPIGDDGGVIKIQPGQTDGLLSYPEDYRCTIKPRSKEAEALIRSHAAARPE